LWPPEMWTPDFLWAPILDGEGTPGMRHIFLGRDKKYVEGQDAVTLCLRRLTFTRNGDWFSPSCMKCWALAKKFHHPTM
jgi:hypothetical protein